LVKSASATIGTLLGTAAGEYFGQIISQGVNSSDALAYGGLILFGADGAPGATYIPSKIVFYTGTNAAGIAERMKIDNAGLVTCSYGLTVVGALHVSAEFHHTGATFGCFGATPQAQAPYLGYATDLPTCIAVANTLMAYLTSFGFWAAA
jgi:hypothetical protein